MPSPSHKGVYARLRGLKGEGAAMNAEFAGPRGTVEPRDSTNLRRSTEILREERERATPGQIGCGLVVARAASVVVEGVLRARIDVLGVLLVVGLEGGLEVCDALVDVVVVLGILQ